MLLQTKSYLSKSLWVQKCCKKSIKFTICLCNQNFYSFCAEKDFATYCTNHNTLETNEYNLKQFSLKPFSDRIFNVLNLFVLKCLIKAKKLKVLDDF